MNKGVNIIYTHFDSSVSHRELNASLLANEFENIGISVDWISEDFFIAIVGGVFIPFWRNHYNSYVARVLLDNPIVTKLLLKRKSINVASGKIFKHSEVKRAKKYVNSLGGSVIFKTPESKRNFTCIENVNSKNIDLEWEKLLFETSNKIIVEKHFSYKRKARFLIVGNKCVAVYEIVKPSLVGNGKQTVEQLIHDKNEVRLTNPYLQDKIIPLDKYQIAQLQSQGVKPNTILGDKKKVILDDRKNIVFGGGIRDITDKADNSFKQIAIKCKNLIAGLDVVGVDIIADSFLSKTNNYIVIDVDNSPDLGGHIFPTEGVSRNVAKNVVSHFLSKATASNFLLGKTKNKFRARKYNDFKLNRYSKLNFTKKKYNLCSRLIADELKLQGYKVKWFDRRNFIVKAGEISSGFRVTNLNSVPACKVTKDKVLTNSLLSRAGISVSTGEAFSLSQKESALQYALSLRCPVVVKPIDGIKGRGISVGINSKDEFRRAWDGACAETQKGVIIEKQFNGHEARFVVVGHKCVAVYQKIPPQVIGNGYDTIKVLIADKNAERAKNPHLRTQKKIAVDEHRLDVLKNQGLELSSVPSKGKVVQIDWMASISVGGETLDITDNVHPSFLHLAGKVGASVLGFHVIGVDILAYDFLEPVNEGNYIVLEVNSRPSIGGHHYPAYGTSRNVAREIANYSLQIHGIPFYYRIKGKMRSMIARKLHAFKGQNNY